MAHSTPKLHSNHYLLHGIYEATKKHYQQGRVRKRERPIADAEQLKAYTGKQQNPSQNTSSITTQVAESLF